MDTQADAKRLGGAMVMRGLAAVLFGAAAVFWPGLTLVTLVYLFSAFVLINGVINIVMGFGNIERGNGTLPVRMLVILLGFLEVSVGVYFLRHPGVSFGTIILLIGFTLLVRGVFEVIGGLFESGSGTSKIAQVIGGLLAILAGVVILFQPASSGIAFVWIIGVYALITGALLIGMSLSVMSDNGPTAKPARR